MHMRIPDEPSGEWVSLADRKIALASFINGNVRAVEHLGGNKFAYFDSMFLVVLEEEANEIIKEGMLQTAVETGLPLTDPDQALEDLLLETGRGEMLSSDGEENSEDLFMIYRLN